MKHQQEESDEQSWLGAFWRTRPSEEAAVATTEETAVQPKVPELPIGSERRPSEPPDPWANDGSEHEDSDASLPGSTAISTARLLQKLSGGARCVSGRAEEGAAVAAAGAYAGSSSSSSPSPVLRQRPHHRAARGGGGGGGGGEGGGGAADEWSSSRSSGSSRRPGADEVAAAATQRGRAGDSSRRFDDGRSSSSSGFFVTGGGHGGGIKGPEASPTANSTTRPVPADELPPDSPGTEGAGMLRLKLAHWPGTMRWAESLDDSTASVERAVAHTVERLANERGLQGSREEESQRRLLALLRGPQRAAPVARPPPALQLGDQPQAMALLSAPPALEAKASSGGSQRYYAAQLNPKLMENPQVFRELLCISDEPALHWIADEMRTMPLPPNVHPVDPKSRDPLVLAALARSSPEVPPVLYMTVVGSQPQVLVRHPYQEVFEQTVALASLLDRSAAPHALLDAAQEAWTTQCKEAVTSWREERGPHGDAEWVNVSSGERSMQDPRQHLMRELQLGCRLMAMLRARTQSQSSSFGPWSVAIGGAARTGG